MNHFIEYICRSAVRSEDAICRLNKRVTKLAKCCRQTDVALICIGVGCLMTAAVVCFQDDEIKALQKQVADLNSKMEEQNQKEGA